MSEGPPPKKRGRPRVERPATPAERVRKHRAKKALELPNIMRRLSGARRFPENTCPASRHVQIMGETLAGGEEYQMFLEDPELCAQSLLLTVEALYRARSELAKLKRELCPQKVSDAP